MRSGDIPHATANLAAQAALPKISPFDAKSLLALGVRPLDRTALLYILSSYNTANANNLIAALVIRTLLGHETARGKDEANNSPPTMCDSRLPALPAMIGRDDMAGDLWQALEGLRSPLSMDDNPILPSLYRHLAHWPAYLKEAAIRLRPLFEDGDIEKSARAVLRTGEPIVAKFASSLAGRDGEAGRPSGATRQTLVTTLAAFVEIIPELIVVGNMLTAALTEAEA